MELYLQPFCTHIYKTTVQINGTYYTEKTGEDPKRPEKTPQNPRRPENTRKDQNSHPKRPEKAPEKTREDPKRPDKTSEKTREDRKRPEKTPENCLYIIVLIKSVQSLASYKQKPLYKIKIIQ